MCTALRTLCFLLLVGLIASNLILFTVFRCRDDYSKINSNLKEIVNQKSKQLVRTKGAIIVGLASLAESRDNDTGQHLERIQKYVSLLTRDLAASIPELDETFIQNIELASSLHDIGKVGIPDAILLKTGPLSRIEREVMMEHTTIGGDACKPFT